MDSVSVTRNRVGIAFESVAFINVHASDATENSGDGISVASGTNVSIDRSSVTGTMSSTDTSGTGMSGTMGTSATTSTTTKTKTKTETKKKKKG